MNAVPSNSAGSEADIVKAAADWRVRHEAGLPAAAQAEFDAWLAADPRHAAAWRDVNTTVAAFADLRTSGRLDGFLHDLAVRRRRRRWRQLSVAGLGLAAAAALFLVLRPAAPAVGGEAPVIVRAEQQVLPDGSRVELNGDAEIAVHYTPQRREVQLVRGEALFLVAKNPARPFVVVSGHVEVRAVGTTFSVHRGGQAVDVLVTEGRVAVADTAAPTSAGDATAAAPTPVLVDAGSQLVLSTAGASNAGPRVLSSTEISRQLAWRQPRLQLMGTTLAEAVALLNREKLMRIEIADSELARLRLTGFFYLDDATGFIHVLETNYGVRVEHRADGILVLRGS